MTIYRVNYWLSGQPVGAFLFSKEVWAEDAWSALDLANDPNDPGYAALPMGVVIFQQAMKAGSRPDMAGCFLFRNSMGRHE